MLQQIWATISKEFTLLRRDVFGFMILYAMPILLVSVMALIQDAPFKDFQEVKIDLLLADEDNGFLAKNIKQGLSNNKQFNVIDTINGVALDKNTANELVTKGKYKAAVYIPKGVSSRVANNVNGIVNNIASQIGVPATMPVKNFSDTLNISLIFDPAIKISYKQNLKQGLENYLTATEAKVMVERVQQFLAKNAKGTEKEVKEWKMKVIGLTDNESKDITNPIITVSSVQHNVPAWTIFAIFFIAIPFAANLIQERDNGSKVRLMLIPNAIKISLIGKMMFYVLIGISQFYVMIFIGIYLMPLIGLDSLQLGSNHFAAFVCALCISFTAAGIGALAGSAFKTANQSLNTIVICTVILGALGGVWVPVEIMPPFLQNISKLSPLNWGMSAVSNLFLRDIGFSAIYWQLILLFSLGLVSLILGVYIDNKRKLSV